MELSAPTYPSGALLLLLLLFPVLAAAIGINYGQIGDDLPPPDEVVPLVKSIGATRVRIYDANPEILKAFSDTGIELTVGLGNEYLSNMSDPKTAQSWISDNLQPYLPATKITTITVANEVLTLNDSTLTDSLLPAMQGLHSALVSLRLDKTISVTTAHSLAILENSSPPSAGSFRSDLLDSLTPILDFQNKTGSPFLINAYPFFAYKGNPEEVPLDFVLFQPNEGTTDPATGLKYDNMLFAQIDAAYSALSAAGYESLPVRISETGWPSKGDADEVGASPENAKKYNGNLIKMMTEGKNKTGTPMRPDGDLEIFVFALFNENMKPGPTSERNYGLFKPDRTPVYSLGITVNNAGGSGGDGGNSSGRPGGGGAGIGGVPGGITGGGFPGGTPSAQDSASTGYLSISSAKGRREFSGPLFTLGLLFLIKQQLY